MEDNRGVSRLLSDFLFSLNYGNLSPEVIKQAKKCLLDYLGAVLAGSAAAGREKVYSFLSNFDDSAGITVIGCGLKSDVFKASLANGIMSHVLELDDGHRSAAVHAGAAVFSALLPLIEKENIDGRTAIESILVGYEAAIRAGKAVQPSHRNRGFHATGTCGTLGAAMAASKALKLSKDQMYCALGIAGTSASGLLQFLEDGSEIKQYHPGKAALSGLMAAYLAQSGMTAPADILEGRRGFLRSFTDECSENEITAGLGEKFAIMEVYFKPYASCRHCHAPTEAVLKIRGEKSVNADDVQKIKVFTYKAAIDGHNNPRPGSITGAKMSLPFSVAVALKTGCSGPEQFGPDFFNNLEILDLAGKIEAIEEPSLSDLVPRKRPAIVEILTKTGKKYREKVDLPKGEPENPLTDEEMKSKFRQMAACRRAEPEIINIIDIVDTAEENIGELFRLLV